MKVLHFATNQPSIVGSGFCLAFLRPISSGHFHDVIRLPCAYRKQASLAVYKSRTGPKFTQKRLSNLLTTQRKFFTTLLPNYTNEIMKELALNANTSANANNVNNLNNLKHLCKFLHFSSFYYHHHHHHHQSMRDFHNNFYWYSFFPTGDLVTTSLLMFPRHF